MIDGDGWMRVRGLGLVMPDQTTPGQAKAMAPQLDTDKQLTGGILLPRLETQNEKPRGQLIICVVAADGQALRYAILRYL